MRRQISKKCNVNNTNSGVKIYLNQVQVDGCFIKRLGVSLFPYSVQNYVYLRNKNQMAPLSLIFVC